MCSVCNIIQLIHAQENATVKIFYADIVFGEIRLGWLKILNFNMHIIKKQIQWLILSYLK